MAAKRTGELIPLCHPLGLDHVQVEARLDPELPGVRVTATARVTGRTGVEMEALTAVAVACLTVYDMVKAVDRGDGHRGRQVGEQERSGLLTTHRQEEPVMTTDRQVRRAAERDPASACSCEGALLLVTAAVIGALAGWTEARGGRGPCGWRRTRAGRARDGQPGATSSNRHPGRADPGQGAARARQRDHRRTRPSIRFRPISRRTSTTSR